jgi:AAA domain
MIAVLRDDLAVSPIERVTIGTRTAADLRHGPPPDQLGDPYLTAEGATCLYGRGGVGKGVLASWLIVRLARSGHVVMVIDFEGHEREWGSRLRGLGMTDDELARVHYRAPFGPDWTAETGALSRVATAVRDDCDRLGVTYVVVDSYSVATSNGDTMGGEAAAREYFTALATIGLPSLTIAHVKGDSGKFPERPFGSVFVHNLARETWAVERVGDDDSEDDPDLIRFGPHVVALELRNRKANGRAKAPAQFVTFSFFDDGTIEVSTDRGGRSLADLAADALATGPLTLPKMRGAIREDSGQVVTEDALRVTLKRDPRRLRQDTSTRPRAWSLR